MADDQSINDDRHKDRDSGRPIRTGLTEAEALAVEQLLSRFQNRTTNFALQGERIESTSRHHAMLGRVVFYAMQAVLHASPHAAVTNKEVVEYLQQKDPKVKAGVFGQFLRGKPSATRDCETWAKGSLRYLFCGTEDKAGHPAEASYQRLKTHFLRASEQNQTPPYFTKPRVFWPAPWDAQELADELSWYVRQRVRVPNQTSVAFVSGGPAFPIYDEQFKPVRDVLRTPEAAALPVYFVHAIFPASEQGSDLQRQVARLKEDFHNNPRIRFRSVEADRNSYLTPVSRFMAATTVIDGAEEDSLLLIRNAVDDKRLSVLTVPGTPTETQAFHKWLKPIWQGDSPPEQGLDDRLGTPKPSPQHSPRTT